MKKIIVYLIFSTIWFSSCTDMIEIEPENSVTFFNFFKTEKDIEVTVYSMQDMLRHDYMCVKNYPALLGSKTDKAEDYYGKMRSWDPTVYTAGSNTSNWGNYYDVIGWAHMVIDNIDRVENLPKERYDFYKGQAYFVRAFMYFRLIQTWGDVPLVVSMTDNDAKPKTPWREVLKFAIEDGNRAAKMLKPWKDQHDSNNAPIKSKQIPGKGTAYTLLAHMHAWMAEFGNETEHLDSAIIAASNVIDGNAEENYSPEFALAGDPEEVVTDVLIGNHPESIFEGDYTFEELGEYKGFTRFLEESYQSWPHHPLASKKYYKNREYGLKNSTVREMYKDGDKRRDAYFYKFEELENDELLKGWAVFQKRRIAIMDYTDPDDPSFTNWAGNTIVFRLAGLILLRAECYARRGDTAEAIADLNRVRSRAGAPEYTAAEGDLFYTIFKEREKELICEQHRWFDCLRTGLWRLELSENIGNLTDQEVEDGALFFPVGTRAFNNNSLMRQNKYWLGKW